MSKSKHNGIDPLSVLKLKGIDLTRLQLLNEAAPREPINWGDTGLFSFRSKLQSNLECTKITPIDMRSEHNV